MTDVNILNRRLGESLGLVLGGSQPRFKWVRAEDCFYYLRRGIGESFQQRCWADKIGPVWVLAGWRLPMCFDGQSSRVMTESEWWAMHRGTLPYPARGHYSVYAESAQPHGKAPTAEVNANYICALRQQMESSYQTQVLDGHTEMALDRREVDKRFWQATADAEPAFGNYDSGNRGGSVSYGGI